MALGLVQPRSDSFNASYTHEPISSPAKKHRHHHRRDHKRERKSSSNKVNIKLDVILDTPVLVVPRSSCSTQVFVAHLGKISVSNIKGHDFKDDLSENETFNDSKLYERLNSIIVTDDDLKVTAELARKFENIAKDNMNDEDDDDTRTIENDIEENILLNEIDDILYDCHKSNDSIEDTLDTYSIDIRNMNLYSLDTSNRKSMRLSALPRAEEFYSCQNDAIAVVHDTAIRLHITRITDNMVDLLGDPFSDKKDTLNIVGSVIKPLRLSLSRRQYEQLLDTIDNIFKVPADLVKPPQDLAIQQTTTNLHASEDSFSIDLDKNIKRRLMVQDSLSDKKSELEPKVVFDLPTFIIQLQDEKHNPVIEITFRDFNVDYEKNNQYETNVQVSLRSILMEDLLCPLDSKHRSMVTSIAPENIIRPSTAFSSHSCPNLIALKHMHEMTGGSLPNNLDSGFVAFPQPNRVYYPGTPPPSPQPKTRQDNLVIYSALLVDPECPTFETQHNSLKQSSSIEFNCLNLIISVKSWLVVLNFFGLMSDDRISTTASVSNELHTSHESTIDKSKGNTELEISVRSLTLVLIRSDYELAKANVSNAHFVVSTHNETNMVEGRLGSVSLYDLTSHGVIYREKFVTSGNEALNFIYVK